MDSLSTRIAPNGLSSGLLNVSGAWRNESSKEEIHYFDHDDSDNYLLDDGHQIIDEKEREEDDIKTHQSDKCAQDEDIDMNNNTTPITPPFRQKNGTGSGTRKELKLPNRKNEEQGFDLLSTVNKG